MRPFFLNSGTRRLFCNFRKAAGAPHTGCGVLLLPPIAEEMNQTRSFHAHLASRLCRDGLSVLSVDLSSTGDSSGEFSDANWDDWHSDVETAFDWLAGQVAQIFAVAVRSAALHVPALIRSRLVARLCFVDPVVEGETLISELLRVKVARSMFEGKRESLASLREYLDAGREVEVAGYELSPVLYTGIRNARLTFADLAGIPSLQVLTGRHYSANHGRNEANSTPSGTRNGLEDVPCRKLDLDLVWSADRLEQPLVLLDEVGAYLAS